jgi:hypothetical protein
MRPPAQKTKQNMKTKLPIPKASHVPSHADVPPRHPHRNPGRPAQDSAFPAQGSEPSRLRISLRPAAVEFLSRFVCGGLLLALLVTGCVGPRPLKGGKATTTRKPAGVIEQTLAQGENASQATKQDQETVKVRTYTLPAATRIEQSQMPMAAAPPSASATPAGQQPSTFNSQPSTSYILSAPMPVVEREEVRAKTELGAAQKDTARDLAAKLSSLKGIVWMGVGLFVFGLASLVYPPLKVIVASVTTSAALMAGGLALMVLPTMVVGNELMILGVVGLVVGAWFLAHRHGQLSGLVAATTASGSTPGAGTNPPTGAAPASVPASAGATSTSASGAAPKS